MDLVSAHSKLPELPDFGQTTLLSDGKSKPRVHSANKRLGPQVIAHLINDYRSGVLSTELTRMYDIGKGTVLKILTDNGVPRRRSPLRPDQVAKAVALYEQGWSIEKIGSKLGRHDTVVREALRKAGLSVSKDQEHSS